MDPVWRNYYYYGAVVPLPSRTRDYDIDVVSAYPRSLTERYPMTKFKFNVGDQITTTNGNGPYEILERQQCWSDRADGSSRNIYRTGVGVWRTEKSLTLYVQPFTPGYYRKACGNPNCTYPNHGRLIEWKTIDPGTRWTRVNVTKV